VKLPQGRIEAIASKSEERSVLHAVFLRGDYLEATDSYAFVKLHVERDTDDIDGPIALFAFELARANRDWRLDCSQPDSVKLDPSGITVPRPDIGGGKAPVYDEIVARMGIGEVAHRVCLNAAFLAAIEQALNIGWGNGVLIELPADSLHAARIVPTLASGGEEVGEALLMPLRRRDPEAELVVGAAADEED
jgi:hypothetical protein